MRILSPHSSYSVQVFEGIEQVEHDPRTGQAYARSVSKPFIAEFEESATGGGLFPHETELALRVFSWGGLPENVNPVTRIGIYDTEAQAISGSWDDEFRRKVEDRFRVLASLHPTRLVIAEEKRAPKPWAKYHEHDPEEILAYIETLGIAPDTVLAYENDQDAPRADLVSALEALIEAQSDPDLVVATVSG